MRRESTIIQEWDLSCAAAALATILNFQHGDPVTEKEITEGFIRREEYLANPLVIQARQGFSLLDLKRFVERRGYEGLAYGRLTLEQLEKRAPILVPINTNGYNHFVVYRGRRSDWVLLSDPAFGNRTMRVKKFENAWIDSVSFGRVGFIVKRRDGRPPPNRLTPRPEDFTFPPDVVLRSVLSRSIR